MTFTLNTSAFIHKDLIPTKFTCDGDDISPTLTWDSTPEGTQSFALICDDPDAPMGTWDHWILFNIPANTHSLAENIQVLPAGTLEGINSWGRVGYGGPCPPDKIHRYYFKLYALDTTLDLETGASKAELEAAMDGHMLAQATLMGRYDRPRR